MLAGCASDAKGTRGAAAQAQRTASERRRARRKVNQRFLSAMADMGIPAEKAELALSETGNVGVEVRGVGVGVYAARCPLGRVLRTRRAGAPEPCAAGARRGRGAPQPGRPPEGTRATVPAPRASAVRRTREGLPHGRQHWPDRGAGCGSRDRHSYVDTCACTYGRAQRERARPRQVATEWLFSVPEHVLERHLAPDPNTPTGEADGGDARVLLPRRVPLQVLHLAQAARRSGSVRVLSAGSAARMQSCRPWQSARGTMRRPARCAETLLQGLSPACLHPRAIGQRHSFRTADTRLQRACARAAGGAVGGGGGPPHGGRDRRRRVRVGQQRVRPAGHAHLPRPRHARQGPPPAAQAVAQQRAVCLAYPAPYPARPGCTLPCPPGRSAPRRAAPVPPARSARAGRRAAPLTPGRAPAAGARPRGRGRCAGGLRRGPHAVPVQVPPRALTASHVGPMAGLIIRSAGVARV